MVSRNCGLNNSYSRLNCVILTVDRTWFFDFQNGFMLTNPLESHNGRLQREPFCQIARAVLHRTAKQRSNLNRQIVKNKTFTHNMVISHNTLLNLNIFLNSSTSLNSSTFLNSSMFNNHIINNKQSNNSLLDLVLEAWEEC